MKEVVVADILMKLKQRKDKWMMMMMLVLEVQE
jgi:predicted nucleic acid-binding Zn ribbon protein